MYKNFSSFDVVLERGKLTTILRTKILASSVDLSSYSPLHILESDNLVLVRRNIIARRIARLGESTRLKL